MDSGYNIKVRVCGCMKANCPLYFNSEVILQPAQDLLLCIGTCHGSIKVRVCGCMKANSSIVGFSQDLLLPICRYVRVC